MVRSLAVCAVAVSLAACSTYRDDLARGQTAFEGNNHERALAIFRSLEIDTAQLTPAERARYAYLRGMTDYRIGYRLDARHWLLLARSMEGQTPGVLPTDWRGRLDEALGELNEAVYEHGIESLTNARTKAESDEPKGPRKKAKSEDEP